MSPEMLDLVAKKIVTSLEGPLATSPYTTRVAFVTFMLAVVASVGDDDGDIDLDLEPAP